ncbi:MAG: hypothetical protein P3W94_004880 [Paracoccus sp. (in: a-proteobacteria)]|nr:hypothetical protein [Paracoccus sp. (in: a-proteobacteria)]
MIHATDKRAYVILDRSITQRQRRGCLRDLGQGWAVVLRALGQGVRPHGVKGLSKRAPDSDSGVWRGF